jgi:acetyl esterase
VLDPEVKAYLDRQAGAPPRASLSISQTREFYRSMAALAGEPPRVESVEDSAAGGVAVRIYRPVAGRPAIVYFHGGRFISGDLETHDPVCRQLAAEANATIVAVDYRLAPEHRYPVALEDCYRAAAWASGEFGGPVAVCGDSAGGNLAAVVALLARDAGGPSVALQVLIYPVTDLSAESKSYADLADGYLLTRDSMRWFRAQYLAREEDAADWRVSPLRAASPAGVAPALVVTAGYDPLRDEGEAYARRLREAGVRVDAVCFGGMIHGFVPMGRLIETAFRAVTLIAGSLRQALR